jgi:uncharacterized membrane protein YcaP (DUF421 family)
MDSILRALAVYVFLLLIIRVSGRRTLGELSTFDFVLVLIISEACQQALIGQDYSVVGAWLAITTLIGFDILLAILKSKFDSIERLIDGVPSMLIEDGKVLRDQIKRARLDEDDIRESARKQLGLSKLSQIRHAVLEKDGSISVIPWERHYNYTPATSEAPLQAT